MMDVTGKQGRFIATAAVFVCAGVHCAMNYVFSSSLGATKTEAYLLGAFGVSLDIAKVFALAFCAHAWAKGHWVKSACCFVLWVTTVAYSGAAALGFAALTRDTVVAGRTAKTEDYSAARADIARYQNEMELARTNPLFRKTYGCSDYARGEPKNDVQRERKEFCSSYWRAAINIQAAKATVQGSTATEADPQTALIASITGIDRASAAIGLAVFLAIVAEVVSSLGTFVFSRSTKTPVRNQERRAMAKPRLVVSH